MLNVQRLDLILWVCFLCVSARVCAQPPSVAGGSDLPRIQRYLSLEMYSEATAALGPAVKADEFNGELRYLYGSALQGLKKYDDAVLNFRLSLRLDNSRWEAAEHVLQCYSEKFAQSSSNQDRILLGEAAAQLAAIPSAGDTDPAGGRDLREAQQRAQALITILNSPVGTWSDGRLQLSVKSRADNGFDIFMNEKESYLSGTFRRRDATEL